MTLRILHLDRDAAEWEALLGDLPGDLRDVYFSAAYHLLWQRSGDGAARGAAYVTDEGTVLYPFLQRPLAPLLGPEWTRFCDITSAYGYGGPLAHMGGERRNLLTAFRGDFARWCADEHVVSEFIRFHPLLQTERDMDTPAGDRGLPFTEIVPANVTVWCRLSTPEEHRAALSSSTRRNLRKAERAGLTCNVEDDEDAWSAFIDLYTRTMRRRGATDYYLFPRRYFDDCRELLADRLLLLCVRRSAASGPQTGGRGPLVAAALFLRSPNAIHYHLGGSDEGALLERPNNLLFVTAMDVGAAGGATALHLGGGFRSGGDDDLFRFKAGFSPLRARFHLGRCVHDRDACERAVAVRRAAGGGDSGDFFPAYRAPLAAPSHPEEGSAPSPRAAQARPEPPEVDPASSQERPAPPAGGAALGRDDDDR